MTAIGTASNGLGPEWGCSTASASSRDRIQSLAGAAGGAAIHLHRHGLRLQRVLAAAVARASASRSRSPARDMTLLGALFTTTCDWRISDLGWMYTLFFVFLGSSAALWGGWLERAGPRKAGVVAALLLVRRAADLGARRLPPPALADVARLRRDRRHRPRPRLHLAGLDADQMVPRSPRHGDRHGDHGLRRRRDDRRAARRHPDERTSARPTSVGVWQTFVALAAIYFVFMLGGAFGYRVPPPGWRPDGWTPPPSSAERDDHAAPRAPAATRTRRRSSG